MEKIKLYFKEKYDAEYADILRVVNVIIPILGLVLAVINASVETQVLEHANDAICLWSIVALLLNGILISTKYAGVPVIFVTIIVVLSGAMFATSSVSLPLYAIVITLLVNIGLSTVATIKYWDK